mgnify:CR=1 FL=1
MAKSQGISTQSPCFNWSHRPGVSCRKFGFMDLPVIILTENLGKLESQMCLRLKIALVTYFRGSIKELFGVLGGVEELNLRSEEGFTLNRKIKTVIITQTWFLVKRVSTIPGAIALTRKLTGAAETIRRDMIGLSSWNLRFQLTFINILKSNRL